MKTLRHLTAITFVLLLAASCTSAAGSAPARRAKSTTITDRDKGTTVTLHVGDHLKVILANTYWTIHPASDTAVLHSDGPPVTKGKLNGCVPGAGCGTTTETFMAVKDGKVTVGASRTTCGEALLCTGGNGDYKVSVVVK